MAAFPAISMNRRSAISVAAVGLIAASSVAVPVVAAEPADAQVWSLLSRWQALQVRTERAPAETEEDNRQFTAWMEEADEILFAIFRLPATTAAAWAVKAYLMVHTQLGQSMHDPLKPCMAGLSDDINDKLLALVQADVERLFGGVPRAA
ncbi:hypothetical protein [Nitrospirillum sp. BR 11163]|uniref:hypothetical protein n=1 Tax=Nitrospirillum sp. BR 11163 TaxID=3104323 RepID=UPI002B0007E0|nr:hypothetical protein [Nitrospirillum sp. BR 11163]MEA1674103.1 hypothetical protein [Nitrospirillum sp. BR 11163]